jgi:hypothetical protein
MSTIKPPDGRPPAGGSGSDGPQGPGAAEGTGPSFQQVLEGGPTQGAAAAQQAGAAAGADPVGQLAAAVKRGELTPDQAIEQLVERAAGQMAAQLSEAQRAELVAVLREAVETDPSLRELRDAL